MDLTENGVLLTNRVGLTDSGSRQHDRCIAFVCRLQGKLAGNGCAPPCGVPLGATHSAHSYSLARTNQQAISKSELAFPSLMIRTASDWLERFPAKVDYKRVGNDRSINQLVAQL